MAGRIGENRMQPLSQLNEAQQRRLSATCVYIDQLLQDVERTLHESASKSPFPRHILDVTPTQCRVLEDYIDRFRNQLIHTLDSQMMHPSRPNILATRSILAHLSFIDIAIEELKPNYMRGSGTLTEGSAAALNGIVENLRSIVRGMERSIDEDAREEAHQRA